MGFFRRSEPTLEDCIEKRDYQCLVRLYLIGAGEDAAAAIAALMRFGEYSPEPLADALCHLNKREMNRVAQGMVEAGGLTHPAVFALAGVACPELGRSLGRAVIRCGEDAFDDLVALTGDSDSAIRVGAIHLIGYLGKAGIPVLKEILYRGSGDEQRTAARCLQQQEWTPDKPEEKPMFFFLCDDWDELIRLKERALPLLFSLVKNDDPGMRKQAIEAMGEIGDPRVVPVVLPHIDDCSPTVRIAAVAALNHYDSPEIERRLVGALGHQDSQIRIDAAHALKRKGWTPQTKGEMIRYTIASGNWDAVIRLGDVIIPDLIRIVRAGDNEWPGAVYALAGLGPDAAQELQMLLPTLPNTQQKDVVTIYRNSVEKHRVRRENLLKEQQKEPPKKEEIAGEGPKGPTDSEILENQKRVMEGFKWMRLQKVATEQIYAIISEGVEVHNISFEMAVAALSSKDEAIRAAAVDVLSMKGERAYSYIMKAGYDTSQIVRTAVADAVGAIANPSMLKVLARLSKDPVTDVRLATVRALQQMGDERAFPYIVTLFSDEDAMVRDAASHAAATYGQFGLPILIRSLQTKSPEIRIAAAAALGEICDVRSLAYLIPHLGEPDLKVRDAIRAAVVLHDYRAIEPLQAFIAEAEEGEAKNTALLALYEIDESLVEEYGVAGDRFDMDSGMEEEVRGASVSGRDSVVQGTGRTASAGDTAAAADGAPGFDPSVSGGVSHNETGSGDLSIDSHTCEELVIRIDGGEEALSSALLVDLYDEKSSLKDDLMSAMKGYDREFAVHAATLLSKIGWSPETTEEETLSLLAGGKITEMKKGGDEMARVLSAMVDTMPPPVQNTIVEVLAGIGGKEGISGLARIAAGDSGAIADAAAESLGDMGADAVPYIRDIAASEGKAGKRRLQMIIRDIEGR